MEAVKQLAGRSTPRPWGSCRPAPDRLRVKHSVSKVVDTHPAQRAFAKAPRQATISPGHGLPQRHPSKAATSAWPCSPSIGFPR